MLGLEDLNYDSVFDQQEDPEEDYEPKVKANAEEEPEVVHGSMETQSSVKAPSRSRTHKYCQD